MVRQDSASLRTRFYIGTSQKSSGSLFYVLGEAAGPFYQVQVSSTSDQRLHCQLHVHFNSRSSPQDGYPDFFIKVSALAHDNRKFQIPQDHSAQYRSGYPVCLPAPTHHGASFMGINSSSAPFFQSDLYSSHHKINPF